MSKLPPPFDEHGQHWLNIRVYYEDTDFTGMVYHANYLRFFERGRSDFLRDAGVSHQSLLARDDPGTGEPSPYVHVRRGLEALIDRKSYYRLVEIGEHADVDGTSWFGLRSGGTFFPVIRSADLEV